MSLNDVAVLVITDLRLKNRLGGSVKSQRLAEPTVVPHRAIAPHELGGIRIEVVQEHHRRMNGLEGSHKIRSIPASTLDWMLITGRKRQPHAGAGISFT